ncbi:MAG: sugar phosphate isomerase/epimerase [Oscillospiraceae bacterium]|nr:sugar phosphate isomerase/epimerase [Oscillospiraceae bacterium]
MVKLGVNTVLYKGYTLDEAVAELRKIGYDGFEISALKGMCEHLCLDGWKDQVNEIKEIVERHSMPILSAEVATNDADRLRLAFEAANAIGIPVLNIGPGGKADDEESLAACLENLSRLAKMAEEYKVTLCVKAHVGNAVYSTPTTLRAIEAVKSGFFGIDMDPSHIYRAGEEPEKALASVVKAMRHVHIRDCVGRGPSPGTPFEQICGVGGINLMGYFGELMKGGYDGPVCLEVIGPELSMSDANIVAASSYGYMNACLKSLGGR